MSTIAEAQRAHAEAEAHRRRLMEHTGGLRNVAAVGAAYRQIERDARDFGVSIESCGMLWLLACEGATRNAFAPELRSITGVLVEDDPWGRL